MEIDDEHEQLVKRVEKLISGFSTEPQFRQIVSSNLASVQFAEEPYEVNHIFDFFVALDGASLRHLTSNQLKRFEVHVTSAYEFFGSLPLKGPAPESARQTKNNLAHAISTDLAPIIAYVFARQGEIATTVGKTRDRLFELVEEANRAIASLREKQVALEEGITR